MLRNAGRVGDRAAGICAHGCPGCPHPALGPAKEGSPDVFINKQWAVRVGDKGTETVCCNKSEWEAKTGSGTVFINNKKAHRILDITTHCGGVGILIEGSPNVFIGD